MIFKSRQVNTDPEPHILHGTYPDGSPWEARYAEPQTLWYGMTPLSTLDPRPEFDVTRDPKPWLKEGFGGAYRYTPEQYATFPSQHKPADWKPRREQFDNPVNPILVEFRAVAKELGVDGVATLAANWLALIEDDPTMTERYVWAPLVSPSPEQIDHAKRVLTPLAVLS